MPQTSKLLLSSMFLLGACADGEPDTVPPALKADLQALVDGVVAAQVTPGVVVQVTAGDGETFSAAAGVGELTQGTAIAATDRFRSGSILKTFVATAILQAAEAGTVALDDSITALLPPEVAARIPNAALIDLSMLLDHRSGLAEWVTPEVELAAAMDPSHVWSLDESLALVEGQAPMFAPGQRFGYSNTNYLLLGEILTRVSGRDWRDVVRDEVFARAGLTDTLLPRPGDLECPACAHGYVSFEGQMVDLTRVDPSMAGAAGGHSLITTAGDLTRFLRALRAGDLFDYPFTVDAMFAFQPAIEEETRMTGYGFGVMRVDLNGDVAEGHLGGTAGYQAFMLYVPETDRYVTGFVNEMGALGPVLEPLMERVARP